MSFLVLESLRAPFLGMGRKGARRGLRRPLDDCDGLAHVG